MLGGLGVVFLPAVVLRSELAVSRVIKYALSLSTVTFAVSLELGGFEVGSRFFSLFCRKVLTWLLTRVASPLVATFVSGIILLIIQRCSRELLLFSGDSVFKSLFRCSSGLRNWLFRWLVSPFRFREGYRLV